MIPKSNDVALMPRQEMPESGAGIPGNARAQTGHLVVWKGGIGNIRIGVSAAMLASSAMALAGLVALPQTALAQTAEPTDSTASQSGAGEIIVTARKREERLLDVPVAVSALSREAINRYGITDVKAITQSVPTLFISPVPTGSGSSVNIRGLGSLGADVGVPNEVVFNIDGIPVNRGRVIGLGLLDTQRIEVLKGPQSLFFGRNSPAGVVSIISQDPGSEFGGFARASYEFASVRPGIEGAVDLPLGEDLAVRLAGKLTRQRGYIRNTAVPVVDPFGYAPIIQPGAKHEYQDGSNEQIGRITLLYDTGPLRAALKFTYDRYHANSELGTAETVCGQGVTAVTINNGFGGPDFVDPGADCQLDKRAAEGGLHPSLAARFPYAGDGVPFAQTKSYIASLPITYETDTFSITSVSGFYGFDASSFVSTSYSSYYYFGAALRERYRQYSQELRAEVKLSEDFNFRFGGYYEHGTDLYIPSINFLPFGPDSRNNNFNSAVMEGRQRSDSYSAFAAADWDITPTLNLSGGARYTHEKKLTRLENVFVNDAAFGVLGVNVLLPEGVELREPYSESNVSPEITLSWKPQPDVNIYGAFKTGFKAGGTSVPSALSAGAAGTLSFDAEKARGGEIGAKFLLLDRRLRGDITAYRYIYSDLQVSSRDATRSPPTFTTTNAAKAKVQGIELQLTYQATPDLSLRTNTVYNDAHYLDFATAPCTSDQRKGLAPGCEGSPGVQDLSGRPLPRAPKWVSSNGFTYALPVGDFMLSISGDATYNGRFHANDQLLPEGYQQDWVKLDAAIKLSSPDGWEASLSGRNLTDHLVQTFLVDRSGSSANGGIYVGPSAPAREVTFSVSVNF